MANTGPKGPEQETPEDRFEKEIEELEEPNWRKNKAQLFAAIFLAVVVVAALYAMTRMERKKKSVATGPVIPTIEMVDPRPGSLSNIPSRFRWESIEGTKQYAFRMGVKNSGSYIIERAASSNTVSLTPEEVSRIVRGNTYRWEIEARSDQYKVIGRGEGEFRL